MTRGTNRSVVASALGLVLLLTGVARAEDGPGELHSALKGIFRFSAVKTCTEAVLGSIVHFYFSGAIVYDGNGSAKLTQQGTVVLPGSTATSFEESAQLTYVLKPNGSFVQQGTFIAVDHSYTVTGARMIGQIDAQGSLLMLNGPIPAEQETVTSSGGSVSQYLCGASGTAVRIR